MNYSRVCPGAQSISVPTGACQAAAAARLLPCAPLRSARRGACPRFASPVLRRRSLYNTAIIGRVLLTWFPNAPAFIATPLACAPTPPQAPASCTVGGQGSG